MRTGVAVLLATAVSSACVAAAAPAQREDAAATLLRHSQIGITAPRPGHVTIKILKLHLRGKTAALAPLHPRIVFTSSRAARKTILLAAVHTSKRKGSTTYTFILASLTPETRTLALAHRVASQTRAAEPPTVLDPKDQPLRFFVFVTTGVDVGDKIDHVHSFIFGVKGKRCLCGEWESAELPNADASAQRPNLADSFSKVFDDPNLGAAWDPIRDPSQLSDPNLDTGWYDDGHQLGWKRTRGDDKRVDDLIDLINGKPVASIVDDLFGRAGLGPPAPLPTYTCTGSSSLIFDNFNISAVANGGTPPSFSTHGKTFCVDEIATYHWNGGNGAPVGTTWLTSDLGKVGPWAMSGQNPDGSPGDIAWLSRPADPASAIVSGTVTCHDSGPATWSQNADSGGLGFCRVSGREAQKTP